MDSIKNAFKSNIRQYAMLIALVFIMILFQILTDGILLKPQNVTNLILQNSYVIILAVGMLLCILTGGNIDLSVGSVCAFVGAITGYFIITMKMSIPLAIILALLVGLVIGVWQGFWIAYVRIPAFIVTLAGMLLFRGLTLAILSGKTLSPFPKGFLFLSSGYVPEIRAGGLDMVTIGVGVLAIAIFILNEFKSRANRRKYNLEVGSTGMLIGKIVLVSAAGLLFTYWLAAYKGIPVVLILLAFLILVYSFITLKTVPGRYLYAMGGNEKAAKLSGINTNKVLFAAYVNMAFLAAVAGVMYTARLQAATPTAGTNFELDAIGACFIGGASAYGGTGTITGAVIGALVMGVLNNGMSIMGVGSDWQMVIKGLVLLLAVAFDVMSKKKSRA